MSTDNINDQDRIRWAMASLSGQISGVTGPDLDSKLLQIISSYFDDPANQKNIGRWKVAWGPVVLQLTDDGQDINSIYAAQNQDATNEIAIAVSGTNPDSVFDWLVEDGLVSEQVPWPATLFSDPGAAIALGTSIGLLLLLTHAPSDRVMQPGVGLLPWLGSLTGSPVSVGLMGHSLGGALSPTLALWLADTQGIPLLWDPARNATVSATPFAGPTPGNLTFAGHYDKVLGAATRRFWNSIDVVPHAWEDDQLQEIPGLYTPDIPKSPIIECAVGIARDLARLGGGYWQICHGTEPFPGQVDTGIINKDNSDFYNFLIQLGHQHSCAYSQTFAFPGQTVDCGGSAAILAAPKPSVRTVERLRCAGVDVPSDVPVRASARTRLNLGDTSVAWPCSEAEWQAAAAQVASRLAALAKP
jgi:hypothetical protein